MIEYILWSKTDLGAIPRISPRGTETKCCRHLVDLALLLFTDFLVYTAHKVQSTMKCDTALN